MGAIATLNTALLAHQDFGAEKSVLVMQSAVDNGLEIKAGLGPGK